MHTKSHGATEKRRKIIHVLAASQIATLLLLAKQCEESPRFRLSD